MFHCTNDVIPPGLEFGLPYVVSVVTVCNTYAVPQFLLSAIQEV